MSCRHPLEELQRVFEGKATPRTDRLLCGLCGEMQYLAVRMTPVQTDEWTTTYRINQSAHSPIDAHIRHRSA